MIIHVATYEPEVECGELCALLHGQCCCVYQQLILKRTNYRFKVISYMKLKKAQPATTNSLLYFYQKSVAV